MADRYYVTAGNWAPNGKGTALVVARIDVPTGNNAVGIGWQTAAAERWSTLPSGNQFTQWPGASTVALADGSEYEFAFPFSTNKNRPNIVIELEAAVATEATAAGLEMADMLRYWGKTDTI